jgi:hypothetical protein
MACISNRPIACPGDRDPLACPGRQGPRLLFMPPPCKRPHRTSPGPEAVRRTLAHLSDSRHSHPRSHTYNHPRTAHSWPARFRYHLGAGGVAPLWVGGTASPEDGWTTFLCGLA